MPDDPVRDGIEQELARWARASPDTKISFDGKEARSEYRKLSKEAKVYVNHLVDNGFWIRHQGEKPSGLADAGFFTGKLNPKNIEHQPLIRAWLEERALVMQIATDKGINLEKQGKEWAKTRPGEFTEVSARPQEATFFDEQWSGHHLLEEIQKEMEFPTGSPEKCAVNFTTRFEAWEHDDPAAFEKARADTLGKAAFQALLKALPGGSGGDDISREKARTLVDWTTRDDHPSVGSGRDLLAFTRRELDRKGFTSGINALVVARRVEKESGHWKEFTKTPEGLHALARIYDQLVTASDGDDKYAESAGKILPLIARNIDPAEARKVVLDRERTLGGKTPVIPLSFTFLGSSYISADLTEEGNIRVRLDRQAAQGDYPEAKILDKDYFGAGKDFRPNQVIGIRRMDGNGQTIYAPAAALLQVDRDGTKDIWKKMRTTGEAAAVLAFTPGALMEAVHATRGLRMGWEMMKAGEKVEKILVTSVRALDAAAAGMGALGLVVNENRSWILEKFGDRGREFVDFMDKMNSPLVFYAFSRLGAEVLVNRLNRTADWMMKSENSKLTATDRAIITKIEHDIRTVRDEVGARIPKGEKGIPGEPGREAPISPPRTQDGEVTAFQRNMESSINTIEVKKPGKQFVDPVTKEPRQHLWGDEEHCKDFLRAMGEPGKFDEISRLPTLEAQHEAYNTYIQSKLRDAMKQPDTLMYGCDYYTTTGEMKGPQVNVEFATPDGNSRILVSFIPENGQILNTFDILRSGTLLPGRGDLRVPHPESTFRNRVFISNHQDAQWLRSRGETPLPVSDSPTRVDFSRDPTVAVLSRSMRDSPPPVRGQGISRESPPGSLDPLPGDGSPRPPGGGDRGGSPPAGTQPYSGDLMRVLGDDAARMAQRMGMTEKDVLQHLEPYTRESMLLGGTTLDGPLYLVVRQEITKMYSTLGEDLGKELIQYGYTPRDIAQTIDRCMNNGLSVGQIQKELLTEVRLADHLKETFHGGSLDATRSSLSARDGDPNRAIAGDHWERASAEWNRANPGKVPSRDEIKLFDKNADAYLRSVKKEVAREVKKEFGQLKGEVSDRREAAAGSLVRIRDSEPPPKPSPPGKENKVRWE